MSFLVSRVHSHNIVHMLHMLCWNRWSDHSQITVFRVGYLSVATLPSFFLSLLHCADGFQLNSHRPDSTYITQTTFALNVSLSLRFGRFVAPFFQSTNVSSFWSKSTVIQFIVSLFWLGEMKWSWRLAWTRTHELKDIRFSFWLLLMISMSPLLRYFFHFPTAARLLCN